MTLKYVTHEKIGLRRHPDFNEMWLHDRICEDPLILGLGDVRVIDRERRSAGGGRLDLLLFDEDNNRRFEVEVMLGATDPSHIIRTIEYWDLERRRYPGYDHVAVLIAEDVTARFLNVISLMAGSIPIVAIQLNALRVGESIVLDFVQVLDQTDLRVDDTEDLEAGGKPVDREVWLARIGEPLMAICDSVHAMVNQSARHPYSPNYLARYIGLRTSAGVVDNLVYLSPKRQKKIVHISFRNPRAAEWKDRFEAAGVPVQSRRKGRMRVTVTPDDFQEHRALIAELVHDTVAEIDA